MTTHPIQYAKHFDNQGRFVKYVKVKTPAEKRETAAKVRHLVRLEMKRKAYNPINYNDPLVAWAHGLTGDPLA